MTIHHATQTKADSRSIALMETVQGVEAMWKGPDGTDHVALEDKAKDALQAMVEFQERMQADTTDEDELDAINAAIFGEPNEDEDQGGTVVKPHYKELYKTNGTKGRGNGDPFYDWCLTKFSTGEKIDIEALEQVAEANDIDHTKYSRTSHGWAGRLRMTIGNMLRNRLVKNGYIYDADGDKDKVDAKWVASITPTD